MMHLSAKHPRARIQRIVSYVLIAMFVASGTYLLTRYTQGFEIDPSTRKLVQNGLVLIQSEPVDADITVDGNYRDERTPNRLTMPVGTHTVQLNADGYRQWANEFKILGSDLVWLNYPLLIPEEIETSNDKVFSSKPIVAVSPNKEMIITGASTPGALLEFDIDNDRTVESQLPIPEQIIAKLEGAKLKNLDFASNSRRLLATYSSESEKLFVYIDIRNPEDTILVNESFDANYKDVQIDSEDPSRLYALNGDELVRLDTDNDKTSDVIADKVTQFKSQSEVISIIHKNQTEDKQTTRLGIINSDNEIQYLGGNLGKGAYNISHASFERNVSIALSTADKTTIFRNVTSNVMPDPINLDISDANTGFTANGRFLFVQNKQNVITVDFEFDKQEKFELAGKVETELRWIDNFHLSAIVDGSVQIVDFDGNNTEKIINAVNITAPFTNSENNSIFSIDKSGSRYVLQCSSLVVKK